MKWYARWGLVALAAATVAFVACEKPQHVARCVEKCEHMPNGCVYRDTVLYKDIRWCRCECSWPMDDAGNVK